MGETNSVEVVFTKARWIAIQDEAARLGIDIPELISRATSVWISEIAENDSMIRSPKPVPAK